MRHRRPRLLAGPVALACVLGAAGCSGGGPFADDAGGSTCSLIQRLGRTAETVERVDVADPDGFTTALDDAIAQYLGVIDDLLEAAPDELHDDLVSLRAAAEQYRFADAVEARVALDEYAARECGLRAATTTTSAAPLASPG